MSTAVHHDIDRRCSQQPLQKLRWQHPRHDCSSRDASIIEPFVSKSSRCHDSGSRRGVARYRYGDGALTWGWRGATLGDGNSVDQNECGSDRAWLRATGAIQINRQRIEHTGDSAFRAIEPLRRCGGPALILSRQRLRLNQRSQPKCEGERPRGQSSECDSHAPRWLRYRQLTSPLRLGRLHVAGRVPVWEPGRGRLGHVARLRRKSHSADP